MSTVTPAFARHSAKIIGDCLNIDIPSRKHLFYIPFISIWLMFWAAGWVTVVFNLISAPFPAGGIILIWLIFWSVGGIYALSTLLWMLVGYEQIEITYNHVRVRRHILGLGRTKHFKAIHVNDLRVSPRPSFWHGRTANTHGIWHFDGPLTFDYGAKTYYFGDGVDEAEAKQIVKLIQQQFPQYK